MKTDIRTSLKAVYIVFLLLFIGICFFIWQNFNLAFDRAQWVNHTNEVIVATEHLISNIKDIETGQRGFLVSQDSAFLEPYFRGKDSLGSSIRNLKLISSDNPLQLHRIDTLKNSCYERIKYIDWTLQMVDKKDDILFQMSFLEGKERMDIVQNIVEKILAEERTLLKSRQEAFNSSKVITIGIIYLLTVLLIIFTVASYYFIRIQVNKNEEKSISIQLLNEELNNANQDLTIANQEIYASNEEIITAQEELVVANEELSATNEELQATKETIERLNSTLQVRLAAIMDNTVDLVSFSDPAGKVLYMNKAGREMLNLPLDTDISKITTKDYTPEHLFDTLFNYAYNEVSLRGVWSGESFVKKSSGNLIPVSQVLIAHKNEFNVIEFYSTIIRDISEIKKAEEELKERERRYKLLFENNPQPMWLYDIETLAFLEVNNAAVNKYGYSKEEFLTMTIHDIRPKEDILSNKKNVLEIPMGYYNLSEGWTHITKDSKIIDVELFLYGFEYLGRNVRLILVNDITEKKKAEERLLEINHELVYQNEQLDKYAYVISHNIRGPVATLLGLIQLFEREDSDPKSDKLIIDNISKVVNRVDEVIVDLNKVLSLKNVVGQGREMVDFEDIMSNSNLMLSEQIITSKATIKYDFKNAPEIYTIKSYLQSIMMNLLSNSIKYKQIATLPVIHIETFKSNDEIILMVKDNGLGIDLEKDSEKLFGLYKRFHYHVEGKGLGLHLVKTQVDAMGGRIEVESIVNKSTTFRIYLPLSEQEVAIEPLHHL